MTISRGSSPRGSRPGVGAGSRAGLGRRLRRKGRPTGDRRGTPLVRRVPRPQRQAAPGTLGVAAAVRRARGPVRPVGRLPGEGSSGSYTCTTSAPCTSWCWPSCSPTSGVRAWSEHRAAAALPPSAACCPERAADRLGYGPGRESEPPRLRPPDDAQPGAAGRAGGCGSTCVRDVVLDPAVARQPVHRAVAPRARPTGSRRSTTPTRRSPSTSAPAAMTPPDSSPTSTTAAARPAWPGASPTTRITRSSVVGCLHPLRRPWPPDRSCLDRARGATSSRGCGSGDVRAPGPALDGSTPRTPRTSTGRSWTGSPGSARGAARSSPS